jgi:hypothetical protein
MLGVSDGQLSLVSRIDASAGPCLALRAHDADEGPAPGEGLGLAVSARATGYPQNGRLRYASAVSSRPPTPALATVRDLILRDDDGRAWEIPLHRSGVPHYWLLDPERLTLTVLRFTSEGYLETLSATGDETVRAEPFDAIDLPLAVIFSG